MDRTVCELFAGVGGFRCGLNSISEVGDASRPEKWKTAWYNQWEPADRRTQWAHGCYALRFGACPDMDGNDTTNTDIHAVDKGKIPDHNLLVAGFPCQDYSVAARLDTSKGLEGKKGVLWWDIRDTLESKRAPFALLENVDRLLKSPAGQRGRDFAIILACLRDLGYSAEWRAANAADYGLPQRRRRTFIFAYREDTSHARRTEGIPATDMVLSEGFFARSLPADSTGGKGAKSAMLPAGIGEISESFSFEFLNAGIMRGGEILTVRCGPRYNGPRATLGDVMERGDVDESLFIPQERLYYADPETCHSDETEGRLPESARRTWQYIKGGKRLRRTSPSGHEYTYSEGPVPLFDEHWKPARTLLTSEGSFSRTTHVVRDMKTGRARLLTPEETERIQGFPTGWTRECDVGGAISETPPQKRKLMMGNALAVGLIGRMEPTLSEIFAREGPT